MPTGVVSWSQTASSNATADSNVNWQEGQAPSSVNDSAREMMASMAKYRDDIHGLTVTTGTGTAYSLTSYQIQTSNLNGMTIQFIPGTTNTGPVTLSLDGQTARPIRWLTGVDLPAGVLISGSLYRVTYRSATSEWLLHSFDASVYAIPLGGGIDYWALGTPNGAFALPQGQAISRTTYASLFNLFGTQYGSGNGTTTFNLPDKVGRVSAMLDIGSARMNSTFLGASPASLGAAGGSPSSALDVANLPSLIPTGSLSLSTSVSTSVTTTGSASVTSNNWVASSSSDSTPINVAGGTGSGIAASVAGGSVSKIISNGSISASSSASSSATTTGTFTGNQIGGTQQAFRTLQPTVMCNYIIRVL